MAGYGAVPSLSLGNADKMGLSGTTAYEAVRPNEVDKTGDGTVAPRYIRRVKTG
jgi:hypothetical protein